MTSSSSYTSKNIQVITSYKERNVIFSRIKFKFSLVWPANTIQVFHVASFKNELPVHGLVIKVLRVREQKVAKSSPTNTKGRL